jgi:hypothetical protein
MKGVKAKVGKVKRSIKTKKRLSEKNLQVKVDEYIIRKTWDRNKVI